MCGIAGSVNVELNAPRVFQALHHRGPDSQGQFQNGNLSLFHVRLAVQGISDGAQPMQRDNLVIVYNGEIYNHQELREQYKLTCTTNSDTETLLLLYQKLGIECLKACDGMFAIAIYDQNANTLLLARDRAGKKPLYVHQQGNAITFASELNCLAANAQLEVNHDASLRFLKTNGYFGTSTPYHNVEELGAGCYRLIDLSNNQSKSGQWWSLQPFFEKTEKRSLQDEMDLVEGYLDAAVKRRLIASDLDVGCFLSGGIDSGIIVAMASRYVPRLKTYTVSLGGELDESELASQVAERYDTEHTQINIDYGHLSDDIESILSSYGEPFADSSAIPSYYVCKAASEHQTVVINGDGADELFGGYRRYVPYRYMNLFNHQETVARVAGRLSHALPSSSRKNSAFTYAKRLLSLVSQNGLDRYLSASVDTFVGQEHLLKQSSISDPSLDYIFQTAAAMPNTALQRIMLLDFNAQLAGSLLPKMDIASMQFSIEARSPFLCKELLELAPSIPDNRKISGKTTKFLLRQIARKHLPNSVVNAPKRGFESPIDEWVDKDLNVMINDYLRGNNAYTREFISNASVNAILENKLHLPRQKRAKMLWALFCLEIWYQKRQKLN